MLCILAVLGGLGTAAARPSGSGRALHAAHAPAGAGAPASAADTAGPADPGAVRALGDAFRAYDAGDLATARTRLAGLDDHSLAIRDYALWLRGMVALRSGEPARAEPAFRELAKIAPGTGSPFARQVAWRLADCAWARGDRTAAARAYEKAIAATGARDPGAVGTAMYRIAETRTGGAAAGPYRALAIEHPAPPLAIRAEHRIAELGGPPLTASERI